MAISTTTRKVILDGELTPSPSHRRLLIPVCLQYSGIIHSLPGVSPSMQMRYSGKVYIELPRQQHGTQSRSVSLSDSSLYTTSMIFIVVNQLVWNGRIEGGWYKTYGSIKKAWSRKAEIE